MPPADDYRTRARFLRARHAGRPAQLYPALQALARELDTRPATQSMSTVVERGFADGVAARLATGTFTGTDRAHLMSAGRHLGIDRHRVSLILALQQNRPKLFVAVPGKFAAFMAAAVVQALVVTAGLWAWWA